MGSGGVNGADDDIGRGSNVGAGPTEDGRVGEREQQFGGAQLLFPGNIQDQGKKHGHCRRVADEGGKQGHDREDHRQLTNLGRSAQRRDFLSQLGHRSGSDESGAQNQHGRHRDGRRVAEAREAFGGGQHPGQYQQSHHQQSRQVYRNQLGHEEDQRQQQDGRDNQCLHGDSPPGLGLGVCRFRAPVSASLREAGCGPAVS